MEICFGKGLGASVYQCVLMCASEAVTHHDFTLDECAVTKPQLQELKCAHLPDNTFVKCTELKRWHECVGMGMGQAGDRHTASTGHLPACEKRNQFNKQLSAHHRHRKDF